MDCVPIFLNIAWTKKFRQSVHVRYINCTVLMDLNVTLIERDAVSKRKATYDAQTIAMTTMK